MSIPLPITIAAVFLALFIGAFTVGSSWRNFWQTGIEQGYALDSGQVYYITKGPTLDEAVKKK